MAWHMEGDPIEASRSSSISRRRSARRCSTGNSTARRRARSRVAARPSSRRTAWPAASSWLWGSVLVMRTLWEHNIDFARGGASFCEDVVAFSPRDRMIERIAYKKPPTSNRTPPRAGQGQDRANPFPALNRQLGCRHPKVLPGISEEMRLSGH